MKRNKIIEMLSQDTLLIAHKQRIAFHEAGHAAGIHLNNKARKLPSVFFKIIFKDMSGVTATDVMAHQITHHDCIARVEGGRLIDELLPLSIDNLVSELTELHDAVKDYRIAFEADIINLLVGPLAEAKYVAETDDEPFNQKLVNLKALKYYGGGSDLASANRYLQSYSADKQQRDEKLAELFTVAFDFVNNEANWAAINKLAAYILGSRKNIIGCEDIVSVLDQSVADFQNRRTMVWCHWPVELSQHSH